MILGTHSGDDQFKAFPYDQQVIPNSGTTSGAGNFAAGDNAQRHQQKNQPTIVAWWAVKSISRYRIGTIEVEPELQLFNRESQV
jgi:hypothetical protein